MSDVQQNETPAEKPFFQVIVHSFFVIPFLIIVFGLLLFTAINLLTREEKDVHDYLTDIKTGGLSKRWQGAFELSRILANPKLVPKDERFNTELLKAFEQAHYDDNRVRQYLALAMARTGNPEFAKPILQDLKTEKEENISFLIYALGMLKSREATDEIITFADHSNALIRSMAVAALGNIQDPKSIPKLISSLNDPEPNVQWGAAISLARMNNSSGKAILMNLLDRNYLLKFQEVDADEQTNLMLMTIESSLKINDPQINERIKKLSVSDPNMKVRQASQAALASLKN